MSAARLRFTPPGHWGALRKLFYVCLLRSDSLPVSANGVRGWGVRTLGPGSYDAKNSVTDFINQCGDIRLDLSVEYRAKLFWVMEGALFADAGNIWTIHNYENQREVCFKFNKFYKGACCRLWNRLAT